MKSNSREAEILWGQCLTIFSKVSNDTLNDFLNDLVLFVKNNKKELSKVADIDFLLFIESINATNFVIGSTKDDFERIVNNNSKNKVANLKDVWKIIANLVWDLTTMTSEEICPQCKSDHLRVLTDSEKSKVYKECETCFWTEIDGKGIRRPKGLLPADKELLSKEGFTV